jgi:MFS family permease
MGPDGQQNSGRGKWMALAAALLGWMFDGAEMGVFSMVGRPAVQDLLQTADEKVINLWFGVIIAGFLVGAATGGVLFGWLGDRIGRVRAMTLSILAYSVFTGLCGVATQPWQLGALRFIAALGMGGEWSLGVALVMEVWPNRSRAFMAGLIGAAANVGYLLVGFVGLGLIAMIDSLSRAFLSLGLSETTVQWLSANQGWRLMMVLGTVPALLTFFVRLFVPESARWEEEKRRGATSGWAKRDLQGVLVGALGPALIVYLWAWDGPGWLQHTLLVRVAGSLVGLAVATAGYTYPLVRYLQRQPFADAPRAWRQTLGRMLLGACLSGVALLGTWGSTQWAPSWADKLRSDEVAAYRRRVEVCGALGAATHQPLSVLPLLALPTDDPVFREVARDVAERRAKEYTQIALAIGAIIGTILAALLGDWMGRRRAYALLCVLSLLSVFVFFQGNDRYGVPFLVMALVAGGTTAAFYGWLPLYLPELFPTRVRATGQGFGFNFGRILAAVGALQTGVLFKIDIHLGPYLLPAGYPSACTLISLIYLVGVVIIWLAPETRGQPLPE